MIIPLGGGSKVVASITVTYPVGSTCTCTLGTKVLTAKDTSGKWVFGLPSTGSWVVKAVKDSKSKSATVKITAEGQVKNVELAYDYIIFSNETGLNSVYSDGGGGATVKVSTDSSGKKILTFPTGGGQYATMAYLKPAVDLTKFNTLKISAFADDNRKFGLWKAVPDSSNKGLVAYAIIKSGTSPSSYTIDVSKLSGNYYLGTQYAVASTTVYDLRFE